MNKEMENVEKTTFYEMLVRRMRRKLDWTEKAEFRKE